MAELLRELASRQCDVVCGLEIYARVLKQRDCDDVGRAKNAATT